MERTDFILHTDRVPILDNRGVQIDEVVLPEKITPVPRRRCGVSEGHTYYKGAGIIYQGHYANECDGRMIRLSENSVAYQRYTVVTLSCISSSAFLAFPTSPFSRIVRAGADQRKKICL